MPFLCRDESVRCHRACSRVNRLIDRMAQLADPFGGYSADFTIKDDTISVSSHVEFFERFKIIVECVDS